MVVLMECYTPPGRRVHLPVLFLERELDWECIGVGSGSMTVFFASN